MTNQNTSSEKQAAQPDHPAASDNRPISAAQRADNQEPLAASYGGYAEDRQKRTDDGAIVRWTKVLGVFQVVLAVVSTLGLVVAFGSLMITRRQLTEMIKSGEQVERAIAAANRQAAAAEAANVIASKAILTANRPWLGLQPVTASSKLTAGQSFKVSVPVINAGHEPALQVHGEPILEVFARGQAETAVKSDCAFCAHSTLLPSSLLNITSTIELLPDSVTQELVDRIEADTATIFVRGEYDYEGSQGDAHHMSFCVRYDPKANAFPNCDTGNTGD